LFHDIAGVMEDEEKNADHVIEGTKMLREYLKTPIFQNKR
jgi:HD superfamily phosphodiesterase